MASHYIAVLGDLHGHFTLAYRILARWQRETGHTLSSILQVGDFGAYPPPFKADKATMKFYEKDSDELSFIDYYEGSEEADTILGKEADEHFKISADMIFIKGNHEDFDYLHELPYYSETLPSVDVYNKMFYLHSGLTHQLNLGDSTIKIAALGGIKNHSSRKREHELAYYTKSEYRQLCNNAQDIDILLTHDAPYQSIFEGAGSQDISSFVHQYQPNLHFCGHYHVPGKRLEVGSNTKSYALNEVNFRKAHILNPGCIAIVEISEKKIFKVNFLDEPWLKEFKRNNFRFL